jgi:hypothetical protein
VSVLYVKAHGATCRYQASWPAGWFCARTAFHFIPYRFLSALELVDAHPYSLVCIHGLRFALRQMLLSAGFTLTAVLMLALGIGATTAIFSIVEGVLLRHLPFPQPERVWCSLICSPAWMLEVKAEWVSRCPTSRRTRAIRMASRVLGDINRRGLSCRAWAIRHRYRRRG